MIQKPEQYYDTRRHQLYYQWRESEYFSHQEPIYDRTREYIESLEAEHAKLREEFDKMDVWHSKELTAAMAENANLRELVRWAARILTGIFPYVDYSRCTALEAVAAWKVEASKLGIEVDDG